VILQRLRLSNFRQYRGEHELSFSVDEEKNVTVIRGVNGAGKTGLFYALNWVLYGAEGIPGNLINKGAARDEQLAKAFVELHFLHEGNRYVVRREESITPSGAEQEEAFRIEVRESGGRVREVQNPSQRVNVILPKDARPYFFFNGEKIDEMARPGHEEQVKDAVRSVLKLRVLERAAQHLREVAKDFGKTYRETQLDSEQLGQVAAIEALQNSIEGTEERLNQLKATDTQVTAQLQTVRNKLDHLAELRVIQEEEKALLEAVEPLREEREKVVDRIRHAVSRAPATVAVDAVTRARALLDDKRQRGEVPPGVGQLLIEDLLRSGACICGRTLDTDARSVLQERFRSTPSAALANSVASSAGEMRGLEVRAESTLKELRDAMVLRSRLEERISESERRLSEIHEKRLGREFGEDVNRLEQGRRQLENRSIETKAELREAELGLDTARRELTRARERLASAEAKTAKGQKAKARYGLALGAADGADDLLRRFAADMRNQIEAATDEIFRGIVWKKEQFERVRVTEDYRLEVQDRFGTNSFADLSAGERQVLSLSFISGMSRVTGEEAPLVIDTPFGRLSEAPIASIAVRLPELTKQLVLLVTDREIDTESERLLKPRLGREFLLRFDDSLGETRIEQVL
jgi:DNA sulfur modification protein DndD